MKLLTVKIVRAVVAYCMYKKWAMYTASNKHQNRNSVQGVEWRRQSCHRFSRLEQRQHVSPRSDDTQTGILLYHALYISEAGKVRASLSGFEENTQRTWSVALLTPDAWLSENIIRNALDTFRRQTISDSRRALGFIRSKSDEGSSESDWFKNGSY